MPPAQFNERQFEFCVNYQLQATYGAYLVGGVPVIPTQVQEALKGYDAAFSFTSGRSLVLQYKTAYHAEQAAGLGAAVFRLWRGPYLRAELLWNERHGYRQHNALVDAVGPLADACYCAPCFHASDDLATHFDGGAGQGVLENSIAASVAGLPKIFDGDPHSITYPEDARAFRLHSEPSEELAARSVAAAVEVAERRDWRSGYFEALLRRAEVAVLEQDIPLPEPPEGRDAPDGVMTRLARLLDGPLRSVLVLLPDDA